LTLIFDQITAEAALRKAEKQRKVAEAAKVAAEAKKAALEEAERQLEKTAVCIACACALSSRLC
jgi:hypothetical protein